MSGWECPESNLRIGPPGPYTWGCSLGVDLGLLGTFHPDPRILSFLSLSLVPNILLLGLYVASWIVDSAPCISWVALSKLITFSESRSFSTVRQD